MRKAESTKLATDTLTKITEASKAKPKTTATKAEPAKTTQAKTTTKKSSTKKSSAKKK